MRAILFGAGGQLGIDLARECRKRGHSTLALRRNQLDIADAAAVQERIAQHRPDFVINAAAFNKVDQAESDAATAMDINGAAVRVIAEACEEAGATMLHYSTDYVFSGSKRSPYTEDDLPEPLSAYGASKLLGELFVRSCCEAHYVLRVGGVYGPPGRYTKHGNFPEWILRKCAEDAPVRVVDDHLVTPTFGPALAARSLDVLERRIPFGVYHLAGGEAVSWYDFARKIVHVAHCTVQLIPTNHHEYETRAPRPLYAVLSNARIEAAGIAPMPGLDQCVQEYLVLREQERPPV